MVTRRRGVKHTRRRRYVKSSIRKKTYRKKSINTNKKKNTNKITRKLGRLHHVGGAGEDDPIEPEDIEVAVDFIESNGLAPEGQNSQQFVDSIISELKEELEEEHSKGFAVVTRPTKLSLYGKLFEYIFARKDLRLADAAYIAFTKTKNQEKFDVDVKFTLGPHVLEMYRNCFLSLKTKKVASNRSPPFSGYVETGKAKTLLESLQFVVSGKIGESGFKMVVESYCPLEFNGKLAAIEGVHRRVYDIKGEIGTILGHYNSHEGIMYLIDSVERFNQRGSSILNNPDLTLEQRCSLLDELKTDINEFSALIAGHGHGCLVRLDVKESSECRTFTHAILKGRKKVKIPQYRVASSLNLRGFWSPQVAEPSSPLALRSPTNSPTASRPTPIQADWIHGVRLFPQERSKIRDPDYPTMMEFLQQQSRGARGAVASSATGPVASSAKPSATSGRRKKTPVMSPAMSLAPLKRQRTPSLAMPSAMPSAMLSASAMPPAMPSASAMPPAMLSASAMPPAMPSASSGTISKKPRTLSRKEPDSDLYRTSRNAAPKSTSSTRGNDVPRWMLEKIAEMEKREQSERELLSGQSVKADMDTDD
jgi:hypothetical protein